MTNSYQQSLDSYGALGYAGTFVLPSQTVDWDIPVIIPHSVKNIMMVMTNITPVPDLFLVSWSSDGVNFVPVLTINPQGSAASSISSYSLNLNSEWYSVASNGLDPNSLTIHQNVPTVIRISQPGTFNPFIDTMTLTLFYQ